MATFLAVRAAPGTTAPLESVTNPVSEAVTTWQDPGDGPTNCEADTKMTMTYHPGRRLILSIAPYSSNPMGQNIKFRPEAQAFPLLCSPFRKFSAKYSQVRSVNANIEIVVVLSVQNGNTLASQT